MTAWSMFWLGFFAFITITSVATTIARYKALKIIIAHNLEIKERDVKNIF